MKKTLCCLILVCVVLVGLCGCVQNQDANSSDITNGEVNTVVLEDFSDALSSYCLAGATRFKSESTHGEHFENYTDGKGIVANGVGYASLRKVDNCMVVRFNKTIDELSVIYDQIETLTVRILIKHGQDLNREIKIFNVAKNLPTNQWTDFTVTKTDIINCLNNNALVNMVSAKQQFVNNFHSTAVAHEPRMISTICNGFNTEVYIDSIVYTPTV
ncbi:MAG: hypothetical protein IJB32_05370 [Clostridia bacterium]|nr:hypothetical protein [Clostridia bacterium]